jgi:hypothetical protein
VRLFIARTSARSSLDPGTRRHLDDARRPPFEDDVVRYYGQYIALAEGGHVRGRQGRRRCGSRNVFRRISRTWRPTQSRRRPRRGCYHLWHAPPLGQPAR